MSQPSRGIFKMIITNFINSLKPRNFTGELVGKDQFGNKYYQIKSNQSQKSQRWFDPSEKDNFEQEIPAEWESWLRYRRKLPPTKEEVEANAEIARQKKINAAILEDKREKKIEPGPGPVSLENSFPKYDDYEVYPGAKNEKK